MATNFLKVSDNGQSSLLSGITNSATTMQIQSTHTSRFPSSGNFIVNIYSNSDPSIYESVLVTSVSGSTWTITRAQKGTTALAWSTGSIVELPVISDHVSTLQSAVNTIENRLPSGNEELVDINDVQTLSNKTLLSPNYSGSNTGWVMSDKTWTYSSATSFSVSGDARLYISKGDKIKLTQGGATKYYYVTGLTYSSPNTTITILGDYNTSTSSYINLINSTITDCYYSHEANPIGFPYAFNFSPTFVGMQVGSYVYKYNIQGNVVNIRFSFVWGAGTPSGGNFSISLPISNPDGQLGMGSVYYEDNETQGYVGVVCARSTTGFGFRTVNGADVNATTPFTWATGDHIHTNFSYLCGF